MRIKEDISPVAGLGTRFLPATKGMPVEMEMRHSPLHAVGAMSPLPIMSKVYWMVAAFAQRPKDMTFNFKPPTLKTFPLSMVSSIS